MGHMPKTALLKARVSIELKTALARIAALRGESESVIIREAVTHYLSVICQRTKFASIEELTVDPRLPAALSVPVSRA